MQKYTNKHNIPLPLALWLAQDNYDYIEDPKYFSTTTLLKPIRPLVLMKRHVNKEPIDVIDLVASRMGTAVHDSFEKVWLDKVPMLMKALGYDPAIAEKIKINPEPSEVDPDEDIAIYLEQRKLKKIGDYIIGGKFDMIADGIVHDLKTTNPYTYMLGSKDEDHKLQGSIYRWLNPELVTADYIKILYVFTSWNKNDYNSQKDKGYPPQKVACKDIPLLSLDETEKYITDKLKLFKSFQTTLERDLPECTPEELWQKPSVFKYYKNINADPAGRSTKNFTTLFAANEQLYKDGSIGKVIEVKGTASACNYCPAFSVCTQKDRLIEAGVLAAKN